MKFLAVLAVRYLNLAFACRWSFVFLMCYPPVGARGVGYSFRASWENLRILATRQISRECCARCYRAFRMLYKPLLHREFAGR